MAKKITGFHDLWVNSLLIGDAAIELSGTELAKLDGVTGTIAETDGTQTLTNKTLLAVDGSAAAPSIGFTSDTDNGLYRSGTNLWHLVGGGTARLTVDGVNGRIGIGTSTPGYELDVNGAIWSQTGIIDFGPYQHRFTGIDSNVAFVNGSTGEIAFQHGSTKRLRILNTGYNAFGTIDPACTLDVDGIMRPKTYTVATLPTIVTGGILYASDGRKNGEGAAAGTGVLVFADGSNWIAADNGQTVAA